jgi:hypothetical protein
VEAVIDPIALDIAKAARRRYLTDAEFHARVDLARNITTVLEVNEREAALTGAMVALYMASAPLPEPQSQEEWLVEQLSPIKLDALGLTDEQRQALFR